MDIIIEIIKTLAWPVTVLLLGFLFRRELRNILSRLSHLKYKDLEAQFNRELGQVEEEAKKIETISQPGQLPSPEEESEYDRITRLVSISPRAAITEAWREIELATLKASRASGLDADTRHIAGTRHMRELVSRGLLSERILPIYDRLRRLRNRAAHVEEFAIDVADAERYIDVAINLARQLNRIGNHSI